MSYSDAEIAAHQSEYADEVVQRWGDTEAYKESTRRAKGYTAEQWAQIKAEGNAHLADFAAAFDAHLAPSRPASVAAAEAARAHIDTWFYPCSKQMHVALGEMYVQDERFTAYYDNVRPGLAIFVHDAILANAATSVDPAREGERR